MTNNGFLNRLMWAVFLLLTFILTLPAGWWLLAKIDFGYGFLHDNAGISQNIEQYAPQNKFKPDFAFTTKAQREDLFRGIVNSIQNNGTGLNNLSYLDKKNNKIQLLTPAEITHLKDVSVLLDRSSLFVGFIALVWLLVLFYLRAAHKRLPPSRQVIVNTLFLLILMASVLLLGPEKVFNQLHIWIFPKNHQWFFYYEESLMSTMMKAPDLFAYIAAMWFAVSVCLSLILWVLLTRILNRPY